MELRQRLRCRAPSGDVNECWEGDEGSCGEIVETPRTPSVSGSATRPRLPASHMTLALEPATDASGAFAASGFREVVRGLSWVDLLLPLWIFSAMVLGVLLSVFVPSARRALAGGARFAGVAAPLAVGLIVMLVPPFCGVRWEVLPAMLRRRSALGEVAVSCALNWLLGPFLMLALAWATLPDLGGYRTGITLVGLARCIGMVLVWNSIARGDAELCAALVVLNSVAQIALYAPLAVLFVSVISGASTSGVSYGVVARSVGVYLGIPLGAGFAIRAVGVLTLGRERYHAHVLPWIAPWALIGLVYSIVIIFAQQGDRAIHHLGPVFRTFAPLALYFSIMWTATFFLSRQLTGRQKPLGGNERERRQLPERRLNDAPKTPPGVTFASPAAEGCFCDSVDESRSRPDAPLSALSVAEVGGAPGGGAAFVAELAAGRASPGSSSPMAPSPDPRISVALDALSGLRAGLEPPTVAVKGGMHRAPSEATPHPRADATNERPTAGAEASMLPPAGPSYGVAVAQAFTAASNNFELSIAVATSVYGANSDQALAATLGALLEVPVLLCLAYVALWLRLRLFWRDVGDVPPGEPVPDRAPDGRSAIAG